MFTVDDQAAVPHDASLDHERLVVAAGDVEAALGDGHAIPDGRAVEFEFAGDFAFLRSLLPVGSVGLVSLLAPIRLSDRPHPRTPALVPRLS